LLFLFFFSSRRRHTRSYGDWSSDVCSSDLQRRACASSTAAPTAASKAWRGRSTAAGWRTASRTQHRRPPSSSARSSQARPPLQRSEERRVGKEGRARRGGEHCTKTQTDEGT